MDVAKQPRELISHPNLIRIKHITVMTYLVLHHGRERHGLGQGATAVATTLAAILSVVWVHLVLVRHQVGKHLAHSLRRHVGASLRLHCELILSLLQALLLLEPLLPMVVAHLVANNRQPSTHTNDSTPGHQTGHRAAR